MVFPWDTTQISPHLLAGSDESRFKSSKTFNPRSCQWWHLELVAEHLSPRIPLLLQNEVCDSLGSMPASGSVTRVSSGDKHWL